MGVILPEIRYPPHPNSQVFLTCLFLREGRSDDGAVAFGGGLGSHGPF